MDCLSIGRQNHTQIATLHLRHLNPTTYTAISLGVFSGRLPHRALDPLVLNHCPIGAFANRLELMPLYDRSRTYRWKLELGMFLYDLLSYDSSLPRHRWLTRQEVVSEEPHLLDRHLQGAVAHYDAQVNLPERLCLENLIDAREHGASVFNYSEVLEARQAFRMGITDLLLSKETSR